MEPPKKRNRIPWHIGGMMLGVSLIFESTGTFLHLILVAVDFIGNAVLFSANAFTLGLGTSFFGGLAAGLGLGLVTFNIFINIFLTTLAWLIFYLWFKIREVKFTERIVQTFIILCASSILELIPLTSWLPSLTISVGLLIYLTRRDDRIYNRKQEKEFNVVQSALAEQIRQQAEEEYRVLSREAQRNMVSATT